MHRPGLVILGFAIGTALVSTCSLAAQTPTVRLPAATEPGQPTLGAPISAPRQILPSLGVSAEGPGARANPSTEGPAEENADNPPAGIEQPLGPTPFPKVGILQNRIFGENAKEARLWFGGWLDFDYTYSSNGPGINNRAPVMNRFGNEFLTREIGLMLSRPLDSKTCSWGFNIIALAGADASFIAPTEGWYAQTNPRFGFQFTDLNLTAHLPILTDGGVDVKIGRQTTILGPTGALSWQRPLNSSDYAWYIMEEGRYTGISSIWHVNKRLDWYNGIEFGWGTFFAMKSVSPQYITNVSYWLDEDAKRTRVWTTVLTGPTGDDSNKSTTVVEFGLQHNWNRYLYTILDSQMVYSKAPVFGSPPPPGYIQRAYDVYTYNGVHLNHKWDVISRLEWYRDVDGRRYPGGFGIANTDYYAATIGLNYHPTRWIEFRPEIRYDHATNPALGGDPANLQNGQLSISADVLIKF